MNNDTRENGSDNYDRVGIQRIIEDGIVVGKEGTEGGSGGRTLIDPRGDGRRGAIFRGRSFKSEHDNPRAAANMQLSLSAAGELKVTRASLLSTFAPTLHRYGSRGSLWNDL